MGFLCISINAQAQDFSVESLFFLPEITKESSGLIFLNDKLITHNDSGNETKLYEIDPDSELLTREVFIDHVGNKDWEDLAFDQEYIYIADIGNNNGDRKDLKIYRIALSEYLHGEDTVSADSIQFSYQDQTNFNSTPLSNYDAEALISYGDSLYIFTKNWADQHTNIYSLPKIPGDYQAKRVGRINAEGLVAGGVYNANTDEIMLIGYNFQRGFLVRLWDFQAGKFDQGEIARYSFDIQGSYQFEAIEIIDETDYYITSESNEFGDARLWRIHTEFVVGLEDIPVEKTIIFPNPVRNQLHIRGLKESIQEIALYNTLGAKIRSLQPTYRESKQGVVMSLLGVPMGVYQVSITTDIEEVRQKIIVVQ